MISRTEVTNLGSNLFEGLEADVLANRHLPNSDGIMECTGTKLKNGDKLSIMDGNQDIYRYDSENKVWHKM